MIAKEITNRYLNIKDIKEAENLSRFFKTGEGEYGFGDKFLGVRVPVTRSIVKEYRSLIDVENCIELIKSEWHEIRLCGFLSLIELYRLAKKRKDSLLRDEIVKVYLKYIPYGNNWDLVDLVSEFILGDWLIEKPEDRGVLDDLADTGFSLWHNRVSIVSTHSLIRAGQYEDTIRIARKLLSHKHDLIHKATGWMLREMGKRGGYDKLIAFLDEYSAVMPRTALRYSIERLPEDLRRHYLNKKVFPRKVIG